MHGTISNFANTMGADVGASFGVFQFAKGAGAGAGLTVDMADDPANLNCQPCIFQQNLFYPGLVAPSGWVSSSFSSDIPGNIVFNGVYAVVGPTPSVNITADILIQDFGGANVDDFSHTSTMSLSLPDGVTYTSDSGVFDTTTIGATATPEPASFVLIAAGLLATAFLRGRLATELIRETSVPASRYV